MKANGINRSKCKSTCPGLFLTDVLSRSSAESHLTKNPVLLHKILALDFVAKDLCLKRG